MEFRQLLPQARTVAVQELLDGLAPGDRAGRERPHTAVNFVTSLDGHATYAGRSGGLGDDGDRAMFHGLREQFDAILAGTGTLRAERYGRMLSQAERRRRREQRGLSAEPLACVFTRSGELPLDIPLFAEPEARIVVFTPRELPDPPWQAQVQQVRQAAAAPLSESLATLRRRFGVRSLLCEGGPTLFGSLLRQGLVDELFLTLPPQLTGGGDGPPLTTGAELAQPGRGRLLWLLERNDSLYLRYLLNSTAGGQVATMARDGPD